jgi:hypothetical protein
MDKLINAIIRILFLYLMVNGVSYFLRSFSEFKKNAVNEYEIIEWIISFWFFILFFILIFIISGKLSKIIIGKNEIPININYNEILSIVIITLSLYLIIINTGMIIYWLLDFIIQQIEKNNENVIYSNSTIYIINIIKNLSEIIISIFLLIFRRKIIKNFEKI